MLNDFFNFLKSSPTTYHALKEISNRLSEKDFSPLRVNEKWDIEKEKGYFALHDSSAIAFSLPKKKPKKAIILASHLDSPALKIKPNPNIDSLGFHQLLVEVYGSPYLSTWTNKDLGIAGKVIYYDSHNNIHTSLITIDDAPLIIPHLPIHLDKDSQEKGVIFNKQTHLCPILGFSDSKTDPKDYLTTLLKRHLPISSLIDFDLFLYPLSDPGYIGSNSEMIASYRLDNLSSAYASLLALLLAKKGEDVLPLSLFYDHEEIGSMSAQGADSPFLDETLERICNYYKMDREEQIILKNNSFSISCDVAHALNPNYPEKYDIPNTPRLGNGIVIKYDGGKKYSTSSKTASIISLLCQNKGLNAQKYNTRSDLRSGSTIGPILESKTGILGVDIGIGCLSMHASREIISVKDLYDLNQLLQTAFELQFSINL